MKRKPCWEGEEEILRLFDINQITIQDRERMVSLPAAGLQPSRLQLLMMRKHAIPMLLHQLVALRRLQVFPHHLGHQLLE